MANYAFIDVQNTDTTTKGLLGFSTDWLKLFHFLKNKKHCDKVFFYTGVYEGDLEMINIIENLEKEGCIMRKKLLRLYKRKNREINVVCPNCNHMFIKYINTGYDHKANCDVDLTVDAMKLINKENRFYFFTGDGDFEYLAEMAAKNNNKVTIVSSSKKIKDGPNHYFSRLSTKLRALTFSYRGIINFEDINNYRQIIEKNK
jgi:uncharacterized LabA/DUF88 family protein